MQSVYVISYSQSPSPSLWSPGSFLPEILTGKENRRTSFQYAVINPCVGNVWRVLDFFQFQVCRDNQRLLTPIPVVNDGKYLLHAFPLFLHGFPFLLRFLLEGAEAAGHEIAGASEPRHNSLVAATTFLTVDKPVCRFCRR